MTTRSYLTTARANLVAGVVALVLVLGASWLFLVGPATSELADTRTTLVDTADANQLLSVKVHALQKQRDELATTEKQADALAAVFPPTADQPGFFEMVDEAASLAGIDADQVTALSPTAPLPAVAEGEVAATEPTGVPASLAVQTVVVTVEAPYEDLQKLLGHLESMDRAFLVQETVVTSDTETTSVQITGFTYVAPPLVAPDPDEVGKAGAQDSGTRAGGRP